LPGISLAETHTRLTGKCAWSEWCTIASRQEALKTADGFCIVNIKNSKELRHLHSLVEGKRGGRSRCLGTAYFRVVLALLSVGLGAAAQKVTTSFQPDFDFGKHLRYAWRPNHILTRQGHENDVIIEQTIVQSVDRVLAAKGFSENTANPDFFVSCDAGAPASNADVEAPPSPPSATAPPNPFPGVRQNIWYSVDGVIALRLTDARSSRVVWTAVATKKIRDPKKAMKELDQQVEQFVSKAFKSFPPPRK
jgi:hypothetical protein